LRQKAIRDPALIKHLDRACVQTACARAGELLVGAPLDNGDVDARKRKLAHHHEARRTSSSDHHGMLCHAMTMPHDPGLAASPRVWHRVKVERTGVALLFLLRDSMYPKGQPS